MVLRRDERGVIAIGQASHAWICGQLARNWGNRRFGAVVPYEEVCLGAEQHDVGMARWDLQPAFNPDSGLPRAFTEMPLELHHELWRRGPESVLTQSRYAALLAAMHGRRLYELRDLDALAEAEAEQVRGFLAEQREFERTLLGWLRADPAAATDASEEQIERNSQLVWTWDLISLALCLDWAPCTASSVPTAGDDVDIAIEACPEPGRAMLDPWPFRSPSLTVRCEGRRLPERCESEVEMLTELAGAPWETVEFELVAPARPAH
jgi:hypothetical protein